MFIDWILCSRISQLKHCWHFGTVSSLPRAGVGGCSVHCRMLRNIPGLYPLCQPQPSNYNNQKCLQTEPDVPCREGSPVAGNQCYTVMNGYCFMQQGWTPQTSHWAKETSGKEWCHIIPLMEIRGQDRVIVIRRMRGISGVLVIFCFSTVWYYTSVSFCEN